MSKTPALLGTPLLIAGSITLALSVPLTASAHVTIDDDTAAAGSFTLLTFKVPNESATATTSSITLTLPSDTPFAYVSYVPVPGWSTELTRTTLPDPVTIGDTELTQAVTEVTWTADPGHEVGAGQLQLFPLSLGPVPDTDSIVLPVDQAYTDGTVVSWSGTGEGADHPAPVLHVGDGAANGAADDEPARQPATGTSEPDVLARVLGIAGLVLGAGGVAFGISSGRRTKAGA
ncbi:MAG TPA: YcnI family protein [Pseudolysinimonas sp.]|nr:YcnI family protein [Pseudolysinimonas sp.]